MGNVTVPLIRFYILEDEDEEEEEETSSADTFFIHKTQFANFYFWKAHYSRHVCLFNYISSIPAKTWEFTSVEFISTYLLCMGIKKVKLQ